MNLFQDNESSSSKITDLGETRLYQDEWKLVSHVDLEENQVDLRHMDEKTGSEAVNVGIDLSEFYMSAEWDILEVPAVQ
ncbi:hypothetical protein M0802_014746 [Mischocyttarus mexicanus]|nr:hypothetical protein M0802_014746 [Mischocyttarus mexicanus]